MTERFDAVVVGAGHAGLAASLFLRERSIDHVVLERGEIAHSWRTERWDSLRLLTPNWLNRLPRLPYDGDDPDGYMTRDEVVALVERFARQSEAPVRTQTAVRALHPDGSGYEADTDAGPIRAQAVVLATGAFNRPGLPPVAAAVPPTVWQVAASAYRNPAQLPDGGVLVVGASASGAQIADELARDGRRVILAVGEHVRMPRTYRGRDVLWWMDASGVWDQRSDQLDDLERARRLPSPQLAGTTPRATLDLAALMARGIEPVGRLASVRDGTALFSGGLRNVLALADLKLGRLLDGFDAWAQENGIDGDASERPEPTPAPHAPRWQLDLGGGEVSSVVWATGMRPDYGWLHVDALDAKGRLRHAGGVVDRPGLYALGLPVLRRRRSTFICGAEDDARAVVGHLASFLGA